jgi:hypothetical protein
MVIRSWTDKDWLAIYLLLKSSTMQALLNTMIQSQTANTKFQSWFHSIERVTKFKSQLTESNVGCEGSKVKHNDVISSLPPSYPMTITTRFSESD